MGKKSNKTLEVIWQAQEQVKRQAVEREKPLPPNADELVREHFQRLVKKSEMELMKSEGDKR
jgi:hypothetical protein